MDSIKITLENLYDILRNEKKREELQKLEDSFFLDVATYVREKQAYLEQKKDDDNLFASGERDKLDYEVRSIKRILKEIYEKREKKIIEIALNRSRTGSDIIDTGSMLREEKEFYKRILKTLDGFRESILLKMFKGNLPDLPENDARKEDFKVKETLKVKESPTFTKFEGAPPMPAEDDEEDSETNEENKVSLENKEDSDSEEKKKEEVVKTKIKFLHPVPSFVWKDMKVYGPFDTGEETEIFPEVADLLVKKGRAEKV